MSFYDKVADAVSHWFGGDVTVEDAVKAARTQIAEMGGSELADQLEQSLSSLDQPSRAALGLHIFKCRSDSGSTSDADFADAAGTTKEAAGNGSPQAILALIEALRDRPDDLRGAARSFIDATPGAVTQLAPGLTSGIKSRLDFQ